MAHPQVTFRNTAFTGESILASRRNRVASTTIKTQLDQLKTTGRYSCFELKWHPTYDDTSMWPVPKHLFWDSDIAKWIEGACYFLESHYDKEIDDAVQYMVRTIRGAQQEDGYLNIHYTVVDPGGRWSNLRDMHELYNCGHLIEAALAHKNYYKNDLLLEPIVKYVGLIAKTFGPEDGKLHGYPGHPEIEMALLRLYIETDNKEAYKLARYFIEERGNPTGQNGKLYYDWEAEQRKESPWQRPNHYKEARAHWYNQAHAPILKQQTIEGHSVRALYLLTAVADLLCIEKTKSFQMDKFSEWLTALHRLWDNMVDKKMYVTGGVGAIHQWEGFGIDYFLPQSTDEGGCYSETCASIAVMFLAERMLKIDLNGRYGDIMDLCLYNNVMTAMSLDGKSFTYVNQLGSSESDKNGREDWFWCACCPPNFSRLFGSLGGYLWHFGERDGEAYVNVHLYTSAKLAFETDQGPIELEQSSNWPWDGTVSFKLHNPKQVNTAIKLRIPGWANGDFTLDPPLSTTDKPTSVTNGYLTLPAEYLSSNAEFTLVISGVSTRWLEAHPYTNQNVVYLARGPIIYCAEDAHNPWENGHFRNTVVKPGQPIREEVKTWEPTGETYIALHTKAWTRSLGTWDKENHGTDPTREIGALDLSDERDIVFVPYYFRANSGGKGHMRVGMIKG
ncbi:hypothetical protein N0V83_000344 [Neocucurbitaria cava]|uniref:Non-reducing end beta-L-arabinofuranosidase n=1 Tax=Neocucurbitaria cava TaxID=798079 RepID=A0A9W8YGI3_9PLEO|nr:hypothetical protein N0V83_000344 [Neocucurbitaria cava]